jgi:hypothetical protein
MENKKLYIGLGILAVAGIGYYMWKNKKSEKSRVSNSGAKLDSQSTLEIGDLQSENDSENSESNFWGWDKKNKKIGNLPMNPSTPFGKVYKAGSKACIDGYSYTYNGNSWHMNVQPSGTGGYVGIKCNDGLRMQSELSVSENKSDVQGVKYSIKNKPKPCITVRNPLREGGTVISNPPCWSTTVGCVGC